MKIYWVPEVKVLIMLKSPFQNNVYYVIELIADALLCLLSLHRSLDEKTNFSYLTFIYYTMLFSLIQQQTVWEMRMFTQML